MSLDLGPILSSLLRNLTGTVLVVLQVAIALAVFANAAWIVRQRIEILHTPTGIDDQNIFVIASAAFTDRFNYAASVSEDLAYLRGLNGVVAAAPADTVPFTRIGATTDLWTNAQQKGPPVTAATISMDDQGLKSLGGRLLAGREFRADEIKPPLTQNNITEFVPEVIVTQAMANDLFPSESALGKTVYDSLGKPAAIIGIMNNMIGPAPHGLDKADRVALIPRLPDADDLRYVVRTQPGLRDRLLSIAQAHLATSNPDRVIKYARLLEQYKRRLYLADSNMAIFLITAVGLVLLATCLGIYGLAAFNVSTRTRQIGTRRALGARKRDILRQFMVENALLTSAGIVLGSVLALAAGRWLSVQYGLPQLSLYYLAGSVGVLWVIGQLSAWYPARKASTVAPSVATRSV